jgi:enoyl-[acyl-carrier protein] reductase II
MRTAFSESLEQEASVVMGATVGINGILDLYFGGNLDAGFAFGGQVAGRIDAVRPVEEILTTTISEFYATVGRLAGAFGPG